MSCEVYPDIPIKQMASEKLIYTVDMAIRGIGTDTLSSYVVSQSSTDFTLSNEQIVASPSSGAASQAFSFELTGGTPENFDTITIVFTLASGQKMTEVIIYECLLNRLI